MRYRITPIPLYYVKERKEMKELYDAIKDETYTFDEAALQTVWHLLYDAKVLITTAFLAYTILVAGVTLWIINEAEHFSKYGMENPLFVVWAPWVFCMIFKHLGMKRIKFILNRFDEFERYGIKYINRVDVKMNGDIISTSTDNDNDLDYIK